MSNELEPKVELVGRMRKVACVPGMNEAKCLMLDGNALFSGWIFFHIDYHHKNHERKMRNCQ